MWRASRREHDHTFGLGLACFGCPRPNMRSFGPRERMHAQLVHPSLPAGNASAASCARSAPCRAPASSPSPPRRQHRGASPSRGSAAGRQQPGALSRRRSRGGVAAARTCVRTSCARAGCSCRPRGFVARASDRARAGSRAAAAAPSTEVLVRSCTIMRVSGCGSVLSTRVEWNVHCSVVSHVSSLVDVHCESTWEKHDRESARGIH